jgi:hypoxanthine phosphoribosyltransferase
MALSMDYLRSMTASQLSVQYETYMRYIERWVQEEAEQQSQLRWLQKAERKAKDRADKFQEMVKQQREDIALTEYCFKNDSETVRNIRAVQLEKLH